MKRLWLSGHIEDKILDEPALPQHAPLEIPKSHPNHQQFFMLNTQVTFPRRSRNLPKSYRRPSVVRHHHVLDHPEHAACKIVQHPAVRSDLCQPAGSKENPSMCYGGRRILHPVRTVSFDNWLTSRKPCFSPWGDLERVIKDQDKHNKNV